MSRKKTGSQPVQNKQKRNPLHCGTISSEDMRQMQRATDRQIRIESGITRPVGTGAHWKGKKGENRAERRASRQDAARYTRGDY